MKANKIIATLVVLAMVLSTLVVMNQLNINVIGNAGAQPGYDAFGNATSEIVYGHQYASGTIKINTTNWTAFEDEKCYLYYPNYVETGAGPTASSFTWEGPFAISGISVYVTATLAEDILNTAGSAITFNRSGMWIFDNDASHDGSDPSSFAGYVWVNTSTVYTIASIPDFTYGSENPVTITVDTANDTGCMISILDPDNETIYNAYRNTGTVTLGYTNFTYAGDYTVLAYRDLDGTLIYTYGDEGGNAYNSSYGGYLPFPDISAAGDHYLYDNVGPWDPPERNATPVTFTVNTGKPNIVLTNTTLYWGYQARIDINVTDPEGAGLDDLSAIKLKFGSTYADIATLIANSTVDVLNLGDGNYSIIIERVDGWHDLAESISNLNVNGTWRVVFGEDMNGDGIDEWNNSATFVVRSSRPPVQLIILTPENKKIDVPAYVPGSGIATITTLEFNILGTSISGERAYYGDDSGENADNITISGDILYPVTPSYSGSEGIWNADVTPTQPGGSITIAIDWPGSDNGSASETIEIVNGTYVTAAVESFTVGSDYNLTITVKDTDQTPVKNAQIWLMWQDGGVQFNHTSGTNKAGNGLNGEYTFWIQPHNKDATTPDTAPQNITIAAEWYTGFWGYTKVVMARNHNMMVNVTPTTAYAGDPQTYDITISLLTGGNPEKSGLTVALYNETGALVSGEDAYSHASAYSITDEEIILSGGTYQLYAYNDTHDSEGYNATIIITNYTVTSSPATLAWLIDTAVNMTFQVSPAGNGTLTIKNMSALPNASDVGASTQVSIENGVGTLDEVNATTLGNVTFSYTPDGGEERSADGLVRVTTATATPVPGTVYLGEPTLVTITVTHPATGVPLADVRVGLDHGVPLNESVLAKLPSDQFTDSAGQAQFSITADASGNITIYIENETDPNNPFVIFAEARKTMTITTDPSANEGATFVLQAKSGGTLITDATVTITFAGQTYTTNTGTATLTAPTVPTSLTYTITATAPGYTTATTTILIINVPTLVIIPPTTQPKGTQTFTITIANDQGAGVAGATVTFNGKTYYSGANGLTELTAPDVKQKTQDFTVTASHTGYTDATPVTITIAQTPGVPGFEVLTLVVALGVAFLLIRRRQK